MKVGSYGTGGRTYTTYRTVGGDAKARQRRAGRICCSLIFGIIAVAWLAAEWDARQTIEALGELSKNTVSLPRGQAGVDALLGGAVGAQGRLVHLAGVAVQAREDTIDQDFEFRFPGVAKVERDTQYCQWAEFRHERTVREGNDANGNPVERTDVSYSYMLDWRSHRINSLFFDNPVAYNNPDRDPFPSYSAAADAALGENANLLVKGGLLRVEAPKPFRIPGNAGISEIARAHGFDRHDGTWLYSPYTESPLFWGAKAAAAYFVDGVIDTGIQGVCTPGDIRVRFNIAQFPETISIIGVLNDHQELVPGKAANGREILLSAAGDKSADEIANEHVAETEWSLTKMRGLTALVGLGWLVAMHLWQKQEQSEQKQD